MRWDGTEKTRIELLSVCFDLYKIISFSLLFPCRLIFVHLTCSDWQLWGQARILMICCSGCRVISTVRVPFSDGPHRHIRNEHRHLQLHHSFTQNASMGCWCGHTATWTPNWLPQYMKDYWNLCGLHVFLCTEGSSRQVRVTIGSKESHRCLRQ